MSIDLKQEMEAYRSLADLLERAEKTRRLFEQARVPQPDALQRLIRSNGHAPSGQLPMAASFKPTPPPDAEQDWIWIALKDATPGTLALAVLRDSAEPLTAKEIHEKVAAVSDGTVSLGTILNVGTRAFENGIIDRTPDGHWTLKGVSKAAVIRGELVWGPPAVFQNQELASHRRAAIMHLLRQNPVGLQQSQILSQLRQQELVRPPIGVSKALIKADMEAMEGSLARRRGNSKKWEAI